MNNQIRNILLIALIIIAIYYFYFYNKENLTNISSNDQEIINKIYDYFVLNKDTDFSAYLNYLKEIKNTNLQIIDREVYTTFKVLKKRNSLTKTEIAQMMELQ